jgi:hypothetical protein
LLLAKRAQVRVNERQPLIKKKGKLSLLQFFT